MPSVDEPVTKRDLIRSYNLLVRGIENEALGDEDRAFGGVVQMAKGKLVEGMAQHIIQLAWQDLGGSDERISFGNVKTYKIPVQSDYVASLSKEVRKYIRSRMDDHFYRVQVDKHVFVDEVFVIGIECKTYAENAMLKRILVDFRLLKSLHPKLVCCLLQLESMLGGDYSYPLKTLHFGSPSTHTLMSYFPEITLNIITLLEGDRRVDKPIHQSEHYKELRPESLDRAIERFSELLRPFL